MRLRLPIRRQDLDELGHVNQAVYHAYLEELRMALFLERLGEPRAFVLVRIELDYRNEVRHSDGYIEGDAEVEGIGDSSVTIRHRLLLPEGTIAAEGRSILVGWDGKRRGSRRLTAEERAALTR